MRARATPGHRGADRTLRRVSAGVSGVSGVIGVITVRMTLIIYLPMGIAEAALCNATDVAALHPLCHE